MTAPAHLRRRAARKLGAPLYRQLLRLDWARRHAGEADAAPNEGLAAALREADRLAGLVFPIHGRDALALGVREGPILGRLLEQVEEWWAEGDFRASRAECLDRLRDLAAAG